MDGIHDQYTENMHNALSNCVDFDTLDENENEINDFLINVVSREVNTFQLNVINRICDDIMYIGLLGHNRTPVYKVIGYINNIDYSIVDNILSLYIHRAKRAYIVTGEDAELFNTIFINDTEDFVIEYISNIYKSKPSFNTIKLFSEKRATRQNLWLLKKYKKLYTLPDDIEKYIKSYLLYV